MPKKNIAIFASGEGTNARNIIHYFKNSAVASITLVVSNNPNANVLKMAKTERIKTYVLEKEKFYSSDEVIGFLKTNQIDLIVLAGFLWMVPQSLVHAFPDKIVNIHPALLPKFGGKGMYGMNVHKVVVDSKEKESGITVHFVNEKYDEGKIISQHSCEISVGETPASLAAKVHELEYIYFPKVIEAVLNGIVHPK